MNIQVRAYTEKDLPDMIRVWNEVVEDGVAFPQEEFLTEKTGKTFFAAGMLLHLSQCFPDAFRAIPLFRAFRFLITLFQFGISAFPDSASLLIGFADLHFSPLISFLIFRNEFRFGNFDGVPIAINLTAPFKKNPVDFPLIGIFFFPV